MGFLDSKSKTGSAAGTSGSQTSEGDPVSIVLSAGDDQTANVSVVNHNTSTDFGAIEGAFSFADTALSLGAELLDSVLGVSDELFFAASDALEATARSNENVSIASIEASIEATQNALYSNEQANDRALETVEHVTDLAFDIVADSQEAGFAASQQALSEINRDASERTSETVLFVAGGVGIAALLAAAFIGSR